MEEYLAAQPEGVRPVLERVREAIRRALPEADEVISYQMPAYRQDGRIVLYFAGWKEHYSLYPATDGLAEEFREDLAPYEVSKGTLRFSLAEPVPEDLIERLARFRAKVNAERSGGAQRSADGARARAAKRRSTRPA